MMNSQTRITTVVTHEDIRNLIAGFAGAIELDQIRVDALPDEKFHPAYDDSMWRRYRQDHIDLVNQLIPTVNMIPAALLDEVARLATTYETAVVREAILDLFAEAATGAWAAEEFESAAQFFGWLIKDVSGKTPGPLKNDARKQIKQWLAVTDPLRIAEDPECGYGQPTGFVN
jgi:hypothetical protein